MLVVADNPVAQALIERLPWTDPQVVLERRRLLNGNEGVIAAAIRDYRKDLVEKLHKAYLALKQEEKAAYQKRSFFAKPCLPPSAAPEFHPREATPQDPVVVYQETN